MRWIAPLTRIGSVLVMVWAIGCAPAPAGRRLLVAHPRALISQASHDPGHDWAAFNILTNVYEALVERGTDLSVRPLLAESWYSPDKLTWVFKLKSGVKRHDGKTLSASDVVRSIEQSRKDAWAAGALAPVSGVRAQSDLEVVFSTREPADTLPARLVFIPVAGEPEPGGATGPYRLREWTPGGNVVLEAFPDYHGGRPAIAAVEFRIVADPRERARRLMLGEVNFAEDIVPEDMPALHAASGVRTLSLPGLTTAYLAMDTARVTTPYADAKANPFLDARVREAVDRGVDRQALVAGPLHGHAEVTHQLASLGQMGFDAILESAAAADPAGARQRLERAGYSRGFDVDLDFSRGSVDEIARLLAAQLAEIGIRVRLRGAPPQEFLPRVESRDTSLYLMRWIQPSEEIHETYTWLLHSPGGSLGTMNGGGYSNPGFDELLEQFAHEPVEARRSALLRKASAVIHRERPVVPLYRQNDLYAFSDFLDYEPQPHQQFSVPLRRMKWKR